MSHINNLNVDPVETELIAHIWMKHGIGNKRCPLHFGGKQMHHTHFHPA